MDRLEVWLMNISWQRCESIVATGELKQHLRYSKIIPGTMKIRSKPSPSDEENIDYIENEDYIVDYNNGLIQRIASGRIPDWAKHALYGRENFDHTLYTDYSNKDYFIYADYMFEAEGVQLIGEEVVQRKLLDLNKLKSRGMIRYVVFGDSISTGAEASGKERMFFNRFANLLKKICEVEVEVINKSIGGEDSSGGLMRLEKDVLALSPDLVSIGYGMNDQNKIQIGNKIPPNEFGENISNIVRQISEKTNAEIILLTPCIPNPLWKYTSGDMGLYADQIKMVAKRFGVCVADVFFLWQQELNAGKAHESLLANNINHPNDYGHWIYFMALKSTLAYKQKIV